MPDPDDHLVDRADEQRHRPGDDPLWNESYYLDFVAEDGALAGYARIGLYPNLGVTWWTTMIVGADRPLISSVAFDLPVAEGPGLSIGADGFDVTGTVDEPLTAMTVAGTAPGAVHRDPAALYRGDVGSPTTLGLDLTWTTDGVPYHYQVTTRYEIPCLVAGEVTVGGERLAVEAHGQRDHSWGVRDWWAFGWCWAAARMDDGTRVHFADIRMPGQRIPLGYLQPPDGLVHPVGTLEVSEELGDEGLPVHGRAVIEPGGLDLEIRPIAFGPVLLTAPDGRTSRFPRAAARFVAADGRCGTGWIEWNQPTPPGTPAGTPAGTPGRT
ncbi:MAG: hypothetical protein ABSC41_01465 [Acidimicrobiales bacterium]|jgi:hypothetical protein